VWTVAVTVVRLGSIRLRYFLTWISWSLFNDAEPPFSHELDILKNHLVAMEGIEVEKTTRFSLQFLLDDFHVGLLPATNLVSIKTNQPGTIQHQELLKYMVGV